MAIQTANYTHKAHKCLGNTGFKIAREDMTLADLTAITDYIEHNLIGNLHMTRHACEEMMEYGIYCGCSDIENLLLDTNNLVEIQKHAKFKTPAFLFRKDVSTVFSLCAVVATNGEVITIYGNRIDQKHSNKVKSLYRIGGKVEQLLH